LNTVSSVRVAAALRTLLLAAACAAATAAGAAPAAAASASGDVETRAVVRSTFEQAGGRLYIQLKLVPRSKLPFTTITYRVLDRGLVAKVRAGDSVAFRAQRMEGENVLTALRPAPPCERFRPCE
jgi:Cu/Ag efflux protein CusF